MEARGRGGVCTIGGGEDAGSIGGSVPSMEGKVHRRPEGTMLAQWGVEMVNLRGKRGRWSSYRGKDDVPSRGKE